MINEESCDGHHFKRKVKMMTVSVCVVRICDLSYTLHKRRDFLCLIMI